MNKAEFLKCVSLSLPVPSESNENLREIIKNFPYFQAAHILFAKSLNQSNNILFSEALKNAALFSGNRKLLFELINNENKSKKEATIEKYLSEPIPNPESDLINEVDVIASVDAQTIPQIEIHQEVIESTQDQPILESTISKQPDSLPLAINFAEEKDSFLGWLNKLNKGPEKSELVASQLPMSPKNEKEQVDNIVDRFIQTDPRISKPSKAEFFSPIQMARKSVEDNDMIVSETLAKVYIDQGNTEKAIHIFRKLSLLYPDKSTYFAALILKLEKPDLL
jgi:tetratricopeptide (TPR) repeat protein